MCLAKTKVSFNKDLIDVQDTQINNPTMELIEDFIYHGKWVDKPDKINKTIILAW